MRTGGWQQHERDIQQLLSLDSTPASGSQFYAPGDAVDNRPRQDSVFPLLADCKFTEKLSFSLNNHFLVDQVERAQSLGKHFILPVRFWHPNAAAPQDYIVATADDFAELYERATTRRCSGCS